MKICPVLMLLLFTLVTFSLTSIDTYATCGDTWAIASETEFRSLWERLPVL
jgi:hypothetical protein